MGNHKDQSMALYDTIQHKKNLKILGPEQDRFIQYDSFAARVKFEKENWKDFDEQKKRGSLHALQASLIMGSA